MSGIFLDATTRFYLQMLRAARGMAGNTGGSDGDGAGSFRRAIEAAGQKAGQGIGRTSVGGAAEQTSAGQAAVGTQATGGQAAEEAETIGGQTAEKTAAAAGVGRIYSAADMTMEEYKQYIYDKIIRMPVDPSQMQDAVSIQISEEGFAAMKADPEYEKWVLDTIRRDLGAYNPWGRMGESSYRSHYFGATKKEYRGYCFAKENRSRRLAEQRRQQIAEQEKRKKKRKEYLELCEKLWLKREREQDYLDEIAKCRSQIRSRMLQCYSIERATGEKQEPDVNLSVLSHAAAEFAMDFIFLKLPFSGVGKKV